MKTKKWTLAATLLIASLAFRTTTKETTAVQEKAIPIHETSYGRSGFRLEWRPGPNEVQNDPDRSGHEKRLAEAGFQARWLIREAVVPPSGTLNLSRYDEILRFAQNDKLLRYFRRTARTSPRSFCATDDFGLALSNA